MGTTSTRTPTSTLRAALAALGGAVGVLVRRAIARGGPGPRAVDAALRAAEERFHAIFDQAFQFTLLLTPGGVIVEANETALTVHGGPRAALVGRPVWELPAWSAPTREAIRAAVASAARGAFVRLEETGVGSAGARSRSTCRSSRCATPAGA
jgi:PAS domain-containing protein